ncbi:hypothetical protein TSUD_253570 [Trifolium subterraneum]|nr:hypothetical protein TSUD_253570 [Trifolium subterraneum]
MFTTSRPKFLQSSSNPYCHWVVHMQSDLLTGWIKIVIPRMEIPMWFNKQNAGSSISMEPLPNMDDKNLIGVAVASCITLVAHDYPTEMSPGISFGFKGKRGRESSLEDLEPLNSQMYLTNGLAIL